jgi:hypothetical protein
MLPAWPVAAQDDSGLPAETLAVSTPRFAFPAQGLNPGLVFTRSGAGGAEHDPRIFISARRGWKLVQVQESFHNLTWVYAGRGVTSDEVWAAAQANTAEGPGLVLEWVSSSNGGRFWRSRGSLQKVSRFAVVDYLAMHPSGKGTLVLRLDDDPSPDAPRLGYYLYLTKNGGREWTAAIFSQGKPSPPSDVLAPGRTFEGQDTFGVDSWQRLLTDLLPGE